MTPCSSPSVWLGTPRRCWKCGPCRELRAWIRSLKWNLEAAAGGHSRTWFSTLTFRTVPDTGDGYEYVQKWLKRLRKANSGRVRFVAAREYGPSTGRLHYHVLLFCDVALTYRQIPSWDHGYFKHKLADKGSVKYVAKYAAKSSGKIRCSQNLGKDAIQRIQAHPLVHSVVQSFPGAQIRSVSNIRVPHELSGPLFIPHPNEQEMWSESFPDTSNLAFEKQSGARGFQSHCLRRRLQQLEYDYSTMQAPRVGDKEEL